MRRFLATLSFALLAACGQSGDLYLPPAPPAQPDAAAPPAPAQDDDAKKKG